MGIWNKLKKAAEEFRKRKEVIKIFTPDPVDQIIDAADKGIEVAGDVKDLVKKPKEKK